MVNILLSVIRPFCELPYAHPRENEYDTKDGNHYCIVDVVSCVAGKVQSKGRVNHAKDDCHRTKVQVHLPKYGRVSCAPENDVMDQSEDELYHYCAEDEYTDDLVSRIKIFRLRRTSVMYEIT